MQRILGLARKADEKYSLIEDGDKIAVGVSGGKDSLVLAVALARLRDILPQKFEVCAITIDMGFEDTDYSPVQKLFDEYNIPYIIKRTEIYDIIFNIRKEKNPCSLCARMRRGSLHDATKDADCNKIALGHHKDDAIETFFLNLFNEGRIGCFSPKSYLSRKDITMIRPLVLAEEAEVRHAMRELSIDPVRSNCPVDGHTNREMMKEYIKNEVKRDKNFKAKIFGAIQRANLDGF